MFSFFYSKMKTFVCAIVVLVGLVAGDNHYNYNEELMRAFEAAQVELISTTTYSNTVGLEEDSFIAFVCSWDADAVDYPEYAYTNGLLRRVLNLGEIVALYSTSANIPLNSRNGGTFLAINSETNPPTGAYVTFFEALVQRIADHYNTSISITYDVSYGGSDGTLEALSMGYGDVAMAPYSMSGLTFGVPRHQLFQLACPIRSVPSGQLYRRPGDDRWDTVAEFVSDLRSNPSGTYTIGVVGTGTATVYHSLYPEATITSNNDAAIITELFENDIVDLVGPTGLIENAVQLTGSPAGTAHSTYVFRRDNSSAIMKPSVVAILAVVGALLHFF